ncbi:MAG: helix-turn-helix transcriptional regulator [Polaromonas sp.]|nr:helix-turn-helix transcriptional regulator [Polaromonas sp.]
MNQYLNGKIPLNPEAAVKFANLLGCPVNSFSDAIAKEISGMASGLMPSGSASVAQAQQPRAQYKVSGNDLVIPQYDAGGSMGNGLILEERQPGIIKSWHVDREWIRHNVPHYTSAENLCIVTGFGPSMRPKYNPGDPLLLDRGVNIVETEGIYFFRVSNHGFIKQLQRIPTEDGMIIRAKSLNKDYDPFDITAKMDFEVFGKVLTVWRSEQV